MKRNLGSTDKAIRMIIGVAMITAGYYYQNILWVFGLLIALTGITGWCPIYAYFGKSTHDE